MAHTFDHAPRMQAGRYLQGRPSAARIAALSGMIAIHVVALMLLLMPMAAPVRTTVPATIPIVWTMPRKIEVVPVDKPKPEMPRPRVERIASVQPRMETPPVDIPVLAEHGEETPPDIGPVAEEPLDTAGPLVIAAVRLEYASAPAPAYPRDALRRRSEGTVLLQVLVDTDGRPLDVVVQQSSGHRVLDDAARQQVLKRWRFKPAMRDGVAIQAIGLVPVAFKLQQ